MRSPQKPTSRRARTLRGLPTVTPGTPAAERLDELKVEALKIGLLTAAGTLAVGGFLLAQSAIKNKIAAVKEEKVSLQITTLYTPAFYADSLRAAFNPSGSEWLRSVDTTDVTAVMNVARAMKTQVQLKAVGDAYLSLTKRRLTDDMHEELSNQEYADFWAVVSKKPKQ